MKKGIDISKWQGTIDFSKVKKEVDFVILREGYRKQIDPKFLEYVEECKNNGIPVVGVYHFCYATSEAGAVEEAKTCIANIEKADLAKKDIVVFFDFEYDTVKQAKDQGVTLGKKQCIAFTRAFCDYVESQGYTAGVYSNLDYYKNMYDKETLSKYVYWLADYTGDPDVKCTYHQYTSSGTVSGISGNVDMNYYYGLEEKEETKVGISRNDVLDVMESWVGMSRADGSHMPIINIYNGQKDLPRGYKVKTNDAYCDTTVSSVFLTLDAIDLIGGAECGVQKHIEKFKKKGIWNEDGTITPEIADIVVFNWDDGTQPNDGYADHIGFVYEVNKTKGTMTFVEGNMRGGVVGFRYNIPIGWGFIRGYALPKYDPEKTETTTPVVKKSVTDVAREVIAGRWGNGDARKTALKSAGYDYDVVQKKVNEILSGSTQSTAKTNTEIACEVIAGKWGNGDDRKKKLNAAGYNYTEIQKKVNELLGSSGSGKKSVTEIAREVIAGKWGDGDERKKKLKAAGYDYNEVQKKVNQLL